MELVGLGSCRPHLHLAPTTLISRLRGGPKFFWGGLGVHMEWYARPMAAHSPPIPLVDPWEIPKNTPIDVL